METTSNNNGRVFLALLGGVAIGALLGVLLAPDKGAETRKKFAEEAKKAGNKAGDAIREKIREQFQSANGSGRADEEMI
jgi:gas vesicle protein